jgi:S-adenosylmethionine hydrolase
MSSRALDRELEIDDVYDDEISDEDYGFIVGPDGELKSVFLPDNGVFKPPKQIQKILKIFGITDVDNISGSATIH